MGYQQLLLIVLGVIIVGTAITVGINATAGNTDQANKDAIAHDLVLMASSAQAYYRRPRGMGGGGASFDGVSMSALGFKAIDGKYNDLNAEYSILSSGNDEMILVGKSNLVSNSQIELRVSAQDIKLFINGWGVADVAEDFNGDGSKKDETKKELTDKDQKAAKLAAEKAAKEKAAKEKNKEKDKKK